MAELSIKFLKSEFCRFEKNYKDLKVRIKIVDIWDIGEDNIFTARIINKHGMPYELTDWTETITETTTKLTKEYDLNLVTFLDGDLPLNIGENTLEININNTTVSETFDLVAVSVASIKNQYLLGVDLQSRTQLTIQQELRKITGVEITEISNDTTVGAKDLVWDVVNQTLQWDNGVPVEITDDYINYILYDYTMISGLTYGNYIRISVEDIDLLPVASVEETVLVDVKQYDNSEFQYWVNLGYQTVLQTIAMTDVEPTLYSSDKDLVKNYNYKYLDPTQLVTKRYTRTQNFSFEVPVNMLQKIIELWGHYQGDNRVTIDPDRIEITTDGTVEVRGFPIGAAGKSSYTVIGFAGMLDRTLNAETYPGARNPAINYWNATLIAGITDPGIRSLFLEISAKIATIDLLLFAGLASGAGIASQSFSVDGISNSYSSTESAENSKFSGVLVDLQTQLGIGKASKDQAERGLINRLKKKIEGGSMMFKF